jgi:hypothetical protein
MAGENEMKIIFSAETAPLESQVSKASDAVEQFGDNVKKAAADSTKGFDRLRKSVQGIPEAFDKVAGGSVVLTKISANLQQSGQAAINSAKAFQALDGAPLQTLSKLDAAIKIVKNTLANGFKANLDTSGLSPAEFERVATEVNALKTSLSGLGANASQTEAIVKGLVDTFRGGFTQNIVAELNKAGVSVDQFQSALAQLTGGTNLSPLVSLLAKIQTQSTGAAGTLNTFGDSLEQVGVDGRSPLTSLQQLDQGLKQIKNTLNSGGFESPLEAIKVPAADFSKLQSEVKQGTEALQNFGNVAENASSEAVQSFTTLKGSTAGIAETFNKVAQSSIVLTKIDYSISQAASAAVEGQRAFANLGNAPLNNLKQLDEQLKQIKTTLATGLKANVDVTAINPQAFDKASKEVEGLINNLRVLTSASVQTSQAAKQLSQSFEQGIDQSITEELNRAGVSVNEFRAALGKLTTAGFNLAPIVGSLDQVEIEAREARAELEKLGTAPINELNLLDDKLTQIRAALSQKLVSKIEFAEFNQISSAITDVDKLKSIVAQLGAASASSAQAAQILVSVFQKGFTQNVTEELERAGISVTEFKSALSGLQSAGTGDLGSIAQVLNSIEAESVGATNAIKSVGAALSSIDDIPVQAGDFKTLEKSVNVTTQAVGKLVQDINTIKTSKIEQLLASIGDLGVEALQSGKQLAAFANAPKTSKLKELDSALRQIKNTLNSGFQLDKIKFTGQNFSVAARGADQLAVSVNKLRNQSSSATLALTDVSRVIQDLPFGISGIANNINPMIDSFARLKKETGSTGLALKSLAGSMIGAGGIGLAIGVVTAAFQIYQNGILGFNRKTKEAEDKFKDFLDSLRDAEQITSDAIGSVEGEVAKVQTLTSVVNDLNASTSDRKRALDELKQVNKEYFGAMTLEQAALGGLTKATDEYTNALISQAVAKGFADEITKIAPELKKQEGILTKLEGQYKAQGKISGQMLNNATKFGAAYQDVAAVAKNADVEEAFLKQRDLVEGLRSQMVGLKGDYSETLKEALKFKDIDGGSSGGTKKEDAQLKALKQQLDEYKSKLEVINKLREKGLLPKFREDDAERLETGILDVLAKIDKREVEIKLKPRLEIDAELTDVQVKEIEDSANKRLAFTKMQAPLSLIIDTRQVITRAQAAANEALKKVGITETVSPGNIIKIDPKAFEPMNATFATAGANAAKAFTDSMGAVLTEGIVKSLQNAAFEGFVLLGETLGNIFSGGGIAAAAESFLQLIGGVLTEIGKQIILTSKAMAAVSAALKAMFANPVTGAAAGIIAGVGLIAVGTLLKKIKLGGANKFAEGGLVLGPTLGMVGEAGPEMVIPLNRANQFIDGGGGGGFVAETQLRGRDIAIMIRRELESQRRTGF